MKEWPDSALLSYLIARGAWTPMIGHTEPTDDELLAILADAEAEGGQ